MMLDLAKLLRRNFRMLVDAGCRNIQIDEPLFTMASDEEVRAAVEAINLAIEDIPKDVHISVHYCQGNYAVGKEYDGQIGHRYFDTGRYKADIVCKIACSSILIEHNIVLTTRVSYMISSSALARHQRPGPESRTPQQVADRIQLSSASPNKQ